jgi:hypothetical protein
MTTFEDIMKPFHNWVWIWSEIGRVRHYNYNPKRLQPWEKTDSMIVKHLRFMNDNKILDYQEDLRYVYSEGYRSLSHIKLLLSELPFPNERIAEQGMSDFASKQWGGRHVRFDHSDYSDNLIQCEYTLINEVYIFDE